MSDGWMIVGWYHKVKLNKYSNIFFNKNTKLEWKFVYYIIGVITNLPKETDFFLNRKFNLDAFINL